LSKPDAVTKGETTTLKEAIAQKVEEIAAAASKHDGKQ
jgi:hypothetical protein